MAEEGGCDDDLWFENLPWLDLSMFDDDDDVGNRAIETTKTPSETQSADLLPRHDESSRSSMEKRDETDDSGTDLLSNEGSNNEVVVVPTIHVLNERERRKKMNDALVRLHALLPQPHLKLFSGAVIEAAANYINSLKHTLHQLQLRKQEKDRLASLKEQIVPYDQGPSNASRFNSLSFQALVSSKVFLNVCEGEAQYSVQSPKMLGTLSTILSVLDKYMLRVLYVSVSSNRGVTYYYIRALASEVHADTLMAKLKVEDRYRQAAFEISQWVQ